MNKLIAVSVALLVAGCNTPMKLIAPEAKVISVPPDYYNCPVETKFPNTAKLTNKEVGSLILKLHKNNVTCKNSLDSIKTYLDNAQATVDKR